jgi:hypothetical protein
MMDELDGLEIEQETMIYISYITLQPRAYVAPLKYNAVSAASCSRN